MEPDLIIKDDYIGIKIGPKWKAAVGLRTAVAAGYAFLGDRCLEAQMLASLFSTEAGLDFEGFIVLTKKLSGNFAVIVKSGGLLFAAVDKVRSHPIFYCLEDGKLYAGDDVNGMKNAAGDMSADSQASEEYLMSGYVSGNNTLYCEIKALQAGECLEVRIDGNGACQSILTKRYYLYHNKDKARLSSDAMINCHDRILKNVFARAAKSVNGRKLIIPLSGGVDSRLIASTFREIDYKNVLCISYGVPGNWETRISREAAKKLGYEWLFIPYTRKKWNDAAKSGEWRKFFYSFNNISSMPNISEWLAVSELRRNDAVPVDAVFVPGHTGDFISGGHIHYVFDEKMGRITKESLLERMLKKHYALWPSMLKDPEARKTIFTRLAELLRDLDQGSTQSLIDAYECWEWQERQAKFIINSARTYEFWGYEWRMPLWDPEIMDFWSAVPYALKLRKRLYLNCLEDKDIFGVFGGSLRRNRLYRKRILPSAVRNFLEYFRDTKAIYGIYGCFKSGFLNYGKRNINSMLVKDYLKWARS